MLPRFTCTRSTALRKRASGAALRVEQGASSTRTTWADCDHPAPCGSKRGRRAPLCASSRGLRRRVLHGPIATTRHLGVAKEGVGRRFARRAGGFVDATTWADCDHPAPWGSKRGRRAPLCASSRALRRRVLHGPIATTRHLGVAKEGVGRRFARRAGGFVDAYYMGRLRPPGTLG